MVGRMAQDMERGIRRGRRIRWARILSACAALSAVIIAGTMPVAGQRRDFPTRPPGDPAAIERGKHVVTANKALLAKHGNEIFAAAHEKGVMVAFEAAVAGGIPIIKALREGLDERYSLARPAIDHVEVSRDGTRKYRFVSEDGAAFEAVYIPEVAPEPVDRIIRKWRPSAFFRTGLACPDGDNSNYRRVCRIQGRYSIRKFHFLNFNGIANIEGSDIDLHRQDPKDQPRLIIDWNCDQADLLPPPCSLPEKVTCHRLSLFFYRGSGGD